MRSVKPMKAAKISYIIISTLLCVFGVVMMAVPELSVTVVGTVLGIAMIVFGIVKLAGFFSKDPYQLVFESDLVFGILYLIFGLLLLLRTERMMALFGLFFGLMLLADGLTRVRIALDARPFGIRAWWLILISAISTAILGLVLLFHPGEGTRVLTQLLGVTLIVDGIMNISTILTAVKIIRSARPKDDGDDYELVDD